MKKTNNGTLLVIDGENLLHRSFHKFKNLQANGIPTGAIYGFLKSLHSNIFRFNPDSVLVVFDNGRSQFRKDVLPNYKGSRTKLGMDYESLQAQKKSIRKVLKYLGIPVVFDKKFIHNYECDDFIALACKLYPGKCLILSSDKDFCQLISDRVKIISPSKETLITLQNCKAVMGYEAQECVDYLTLAGDTSDNIPGVRGMGPAKVRIFLDNYKSVKNYVDKDTEGINSAIQEAYRVGQELIDLKYFLEAHPIDVSKLPIRMGAKTIDTYKLVDIFDDWGMDSLKTPTFLETFKKLKQWQPTKN